MVNSVGRCLLSWGLPRIDRAHFANWLNPSTRVYGAKQHIDEHYL